MSAIGRVLRLVRCRRYYKVEVRSKLGRGTVARRTISRAFVPSSLLKVLPIARVAFGFHGSFCLFPNVVTGKDMTVDGS